LPGWYALPAGDALDAQAGRGRVNGDIVALILGSHKPADPYLVPRGEPEMGPLRLLEVSTRIPG
jgi:hypothetical protein